MTYVNTADESRCNACIVATPVVSWDPKDGFTDIYHFLKVIKSPILYVQLIKAVHKGEEILAWYYLPIGVQPLSPVSPPPSAAASPAETLKTSTHSQAGSVRSTLDAKTSG